MRRGSLIVVGCALSIPLAVLVVWLAGGRERAEAGTATDFAKTANADLVKYIQGGSSRNLRLCALDALRKKTGSTNDLLTLARGKDMVTAAFSIGALGRQKTSDSKKVLKELITDTKLGAEVRKAAMSALVVHWKNADDLTWLSEKTGSHSDLKAHYSWLETRYGK
jgi:hypothetical protein